MPAFILEHVAAARQRALPFCIPRDAFTVMAFLASDLSRPDFMLHSVAIKSTSLLEFDENPPRLSNPKGMNFRFFWQVCHV